MTTGRLLRLTAVLLLLPAPLPAQVYRCEQDGRVTFSQRPCGADAEIVDLELVTPPATPAPNAAPAPAYDVDGYIEERRYRRREEQLKGRIKALEEERDRKIAELEREIPQSSSYAVYSAIRREMNLIRRDYRRKISDVQAELREHRRDKPQSLRQP